MFSIFPKYYRNAVDRISEEGFACIITFWTDKKKVFEAISEENRKKVLTIGNLYTLQGMKFIIKNVLLCPEVNYLIFTGNDNNHVKDQLRVTSFTDKDDLFWKYFDSHIIFTPNYLELNHTLETLERCGNWIEHPIEFPEEERVTIGDALESEESGFLVRDSSLYRLWQKALMKVKLYGKKKSGTKEIISLMSVLTTKAQLDKRMPNAEIIEQYLHQVVDPTVPALSPDQAKEDTLAYTYGSRLHEFGQIDNIVKSLLKNRHNRNGVSVTWRPQTDFVLEPPCLILIDCKIQFNKFFMTAYFRSHDIYKAYCMNIYALQCLQEKIMNLVNEGEHKRMEEESKQNTESKSTPSSTSSSSSSSASSTTTTPTTPTTDTSTPNTTAPPRTDLVLGNLTIISNSAHVYEQDWDNLKDVHALDCALDPRGYFLITIDPEEKKITVTFMNNRNEQVDHATSDNVRELLDFAQPYISEISHALYLGKEVERAKHCMDNGLPFTQL